MNRPNFDLLLDVLDHVDPAQFDLATWHSQTDCGTIACAIGHLALDPRSNALGFALTPQSHIPTFRDKHELRWIGRDAVVKFFNDGDWSTNLGRLFLPDWYPPNATPADVAARVRAYLAGTPGWEHVTATR